MVYGKNSVLDATQTIIHGFLYGCLAWAFFSYFAVVLFSPENAWTVDSVKIEPPPVARGRRSRHIENVKPGYYMLNTEGSGIEGVPKYIYLGTEAPEAS